MSSDRANCPHCGHQFVYTVKPNATHDVPTSCGALTCAALDEWGPDDWAGQARMATVRRDLGMPLDRLDREALDRVPS